MSYAGLLEDIKAAFYNNFPINYFIRNQVRLHSINYKNYSGIHF